MKLFLRKLSIRLHCLMGFHEYAATRHGALYRCDRCGHEELFITI